jgi:GntR family transcriptional regulator/MocR family aminotransferase
MALPEDLVDPVIDGAGGLPCEVDTITQLTMADFITSGQYESHIRKMRIRYRRRRDAIVDALADFAVGIAGLPAGMSQLLTVPTGTERELLRRAAEAGISLCGLTSLRHPLAGPEVPGAEGVMVGFGTPSEDAFGPAIDALRDVLTATGLARPPACRSTAGPEG